MPALDFRAFAAGFATQAQKIEEESAKIGVELLKKAMDDFREEAKDYKPKYEEELRTKKEIAKALSATIGSDVADKDIIIKQIMDQGDIYAKDFIQNAGTVAAKKGIPVSALMPIAEANKELTGFSIEDFINSGGYSTVKEPQYVAPTDLRTGVFDRKISIGTDAESIKSAYIPERGTFEGDIPISGEGMALSAEPMKGAFVEPTDTQVARMRKNIMNTLSAAQGIAGERDLITGEIKYDYAKLKDAGVVTGHVTNIIKDVIAKAKTEDTAISPLADVTAASNFALGNTDFYPSAKDVAGLGKPTPPPPDGEVVVPPPAEGGGLAGPDVIPEGVTGNAPRNDPRISKYLGRDVSSRQKAADRAVISGMLQQPPYSKSPEEADAEALALIPEA